MSDQTKIQASLEINNIPLSYNQEEIWNRYQMDMDSPGEVRAIALNLCGVVNNDLVIQSIEEISQRHAILRTNFILNGDQPEQFIEAFQQIELIDSDLSDMSESEQQTELEWLFIDAIEQPMDFFHDPLVRAGLYKLNDEKYILLLVIHQILCDQYSEVLIAREFSRLYNANHEAKLETLDIQYSDYASWQRKQLQQGVWETQKNYWLKKLNNLPPLLDIPTDFPRSDLPDNNPSAKESLLLPLDIANMLQDIQLDEGIGLYEVLLSAYIALLHLYTGEEDIIVAIPASGRVLAETKNMIGQFTNTLPFRINLSNITNFKELLQEVTTTMHDLYCHHNIPLMEVLKELLPDFESDSQSIFRTQFHYIHSNENELSLTDKSLIQIEPFELEHHFSAYEWDIIISHKNNGLKAELVYNTSLYDPKSMIQLLKYLKIILKNITHNPEEKISSLIHSNNIANGETSQAYHLRPDNIFSQFKREEIEQDIASRFQQQVNQYPDKIAIKDKNESWTYTQLNNKANQIAHTILEHCTENDKRIVLLFQHEAMMIATMLAALKSGKTYIPIDASIPSHRLDYILSDADARLIITNSSHYPLAKMSNITSETIINIDELSPDVSTKNLYLDIKSQDPAYIIYTSGSTGHPKGVVQNHNNILHFISSYTNNLHISEEDKLSLLSSYAFDAAVMDIYGALLNGACLCLINLKKDGFNNIQKQLNEHKITIYHSTSSVYRYFIETLNQADTLDNIRLVILGGEAAARRDHDAFISHFKENCFFVSLMGSTESSLSLLHFMNHTSKVPTPMIPIGYPVEETEVILLNNHGDEVALYGEIAIKSKYSALEYWKQPELSQKIFKTQENTKKRIYRTGDMGRRQIDGHIKFEGRKDFQVKIRGYRVEVEEIEVILSEHKDINKCLLIASLDDNQEQQLTAYYITQALNTLLTVHELRSFLQKELPEYMIPANFISVEEFPITITGKIDRLRLNQLHGFN